MNKCIFMLLFFSLTTITAYSGQEGNGGDAIVCKDSSGEITSVNFYDHFEAENIHGISIDLGYKELSVKQKVNLALSRVKKLNPNRYKLYSDWHESFFSEVKFTENDLIDIPDTADGEIPKNCFLQQLAIQKEPYFPGEKRYTINRDLWNLLDNDGRAGLVLHEIIFREARTFYQHKHSRLVRYFNAQISSPFIVKKTLQQYFELLEFVDFLYADAYGYTVELWEGVTSFYDENHVRKAKLSHSPYKKKDGTEQIIEIQLGSLGNKYQVYSSNAMDVEFFPSGMIKYIEGVNFVDEKINFSFDNAEIDTVSSLAHGFKIEMSTERNLKHITAHNSFFDLSANIKASNINYVEFFAESGNVKNISGHYIASVQNKDIEMTYTPLSTYFYESGAIKAGTVYQGDIVLKNIKNEFVSLVASDSVVFSESGLVLCYGSIRKGSFKKCWKFLNIKR